eukprot:469510_1
MVHVNGKFMCIWFILTLVVICNSSSINVTLPYNFTTPFPLKNNCTEHILPTFNRLRSTINTIKSKSIHQFRPNRPIDPFCIVPDEHFNYTFMPDFYCPTMVQNLYCNKTEELQYLHKFYYALGGNNWINSSYWLNDSVDYCKWHGIYCCNTSYPLYQTCINIIYMKDNNLTGTLPSPWINSSVLTVFTAEDSHITGSIPDYHQRLPNLSLFSISPNDPDHPETDSIYGEIPQWPSAGCMALWNVHNSKFLNSSLPDWNKPLKYIIELELSMTSLIGTLPQWTEWQWPYHLTIADQHGNLSGTISPFSNALCPTLDRLFLYNMNLTGTMPPLPPQLYDAFGANASILLHGNKLTGPFPWESLDHTVFLTLQDNEFTGNIKLSPKYKHFRAVNISNNNFDGMFPCLMSNHKLEFVDARFNKFDSIATDKDDCIGWPKNLDSLLLSDNQINAVLEKAVRNLTNMSIIDFGNNRFRGTVPSLLIEATQNQDGTYVGFYDNDISCIFPHANGRHFNYSWLYIGNGMKAPWAPYTNPNEKGLGIIAIAPDNESVYYMWLPIGIGAFCFVLYSVGIYVKSSEHKLWIQRLSSMHSYKRLLHTKDKVLYIMQESVVFVGYLSIVSILMIGFYTAGAKFYTCGYTSLQPTITYMGTLSGDGYDILYSGISLFLFFVYSLLCTWFVVRLMYFAKWFVKAPYPTVQANDQQVNNVSNNPLIHRHSSLSYTEFSDIKTSNSKPTINSNNDSIDLEPSNTSDSNKAGNNISEESRIAHSGEPDHMCCKFCFYILWTIKFVFFILLFFGLLFGPIIAYNVYHSIPYSHMRYVPELNDERWHIFIIYILPIFLAIVKFFGIPWANDQMRSILIEAGIVDRNAHNTWRNITLCIIRFFTMILLPISILLIFDDGCKQGWKSMWDYCDTDVNGHFTNPQCQSIAPKFKELPGPAIWVCHDVCDPNFVPYRCMRRFFEVLGPLYLYKMNIALWFPLLYFIKKTKTGKRLTNALWNCFKCKCNNTDRVNDENVSKKIKTDVEYMSLVSSLEIVIVFGWAIPILVILYGITIFGYWCVYSYWYNNDLGDFIDRKTLRPVTGWLILALVLQHILACFFYWYTQSIYHGIACIAMAFVNFIWFCAWLIHYKIAK